MAMLKRVERLTSAEEAILEASERRPQSDEKHSAYAILRDRGLPTRRVEAWHYTDLRNHLKAFPPFAPANSTADLSGIAPVVPASRIAFVDGIRQPAGQLPEGMSEAHAPAAAAHQGSDDAIGIINALTGQPGLAIEIADSAAPAPLELLHLASSAVTASLRHTVKVGSGAKATIIERHLGHAGVASHANAVSWLEVGDGAEVIWAIVQEESTEAVHLAQLNVSLGADAGLTILVLNAGGKLVRREISVTARGAGSRIVMRGVNLIGGSAHIDVTTLLRHEAPGVAAQELFRNVATGEGRGVFQGQIKVAQIAQKTDARMACNTLLLSDEAEFSSKPELEIFADDVACGHGATVTDILADHLFYLRARGIPERLARSMLVQAFVEEVFDELEDEAMREALDGRIESWLEKNG
jgi:Fe-S cluster assembly protein SufD